MEIDLNRVNIAAREHKSNPHLFYAQLRLDHPVFPVTLPDQRTIWLITRYEDAVSVLKDERFVKDATNVAAGFSATKQPWLPKFARPLLHHMLNKDKPDHPRLRSLVNKAFCPHTVMQMEDRIQSVSEQLLRRLHGQKQIDLVTDYALPIPTMIIAEMLGVPEKDRGKFIHWSNAVMQVNTTKWGMVRAVPNVWAFIRYLRRFIRQRTAEPQDDLTSALVQSEVEGERLSEDELVAMVFLLLVAGHETTVNLIGNGLLGLLEHPQQLERLRNDPDLIKPAVEELLRYGSPVEMGTERYAREDVTVAGVEIPGGALVGVVIASANRDQRQFPNPDVLDITREPNKHIAFGLGAHYCTGASLARLEGQIAIKTLLKMIPKFHLESSSGELYWRPGLVTRGLERLPVTVDRWAPVD